MTGKLTSRRVLAQNAYEFTFALSKPLVFDPGQYVTVTLHNLKSDPKGPGRIFSIVNSPSDNKILKILFRSTGSPYKNHLLKMKIGEKVKISDPVGIFNPPKSPKAPVIFLAAGIGIAPFMSIFTLSEVEGLPYPATLFYANKTKKDIPYLDKMPKESILVYTRGGKRLDLDLVKKTVKNWREGLFFIAGPPEFIENFEQQLIASKINPKSIYREAFDGEQL